MLMRRILQLWWYVIWNWSVYVQHWTLLNRHSWGEVLCAQMMVLLSSLQKVATPTLHPQLPSASVSEIIKQIAHLASEFLVSDVRCRNKASVELCVLENKPWAPGQVWIAGRRALSQITVDYQLIIVNKIIDLCRQVILRRECLTFFTSPVPLP